MNKALMIMGIIAALHSTSQASEWNVISNDLNGYNFYTNKFIKGANAENVYFSCNSEVEYQFVNTYSNPLYRCGDSPSIKRI